MSRKARLGLADAFDRFLEGVADNRQVAFDDDGWRLKTDAAEQPDPAQSDSLAELHRWLDARSRSIRLADLLIEVENDLGFSVHFQQPGETPCASGVDPSGRDCGRDGTSGVRTRRSARARVGPGLLRRPGSAHALTTHPARKARSQSTSFQKVEAPILHGLPARSPACCGGAGAPRCAAGGG